MPYSDHHRLCRKPTMSALLKGHIRKRSGREVLAVTKGYKNEEVGKNSPARRTREPIVPPLKVSSDIIANHSGILPGTNPADYMHDDDAHFDIMEMDVFKYEYGKTLVKDGTTLTTMMRRFHDWYMETCRESGGDEYFVSES